MSASLATTEHVLLLFFLCGILDATSALYVPRTAPRPVPGARRVVVVHVDGLGWGHTEAGNLASGFSRVGTLRDPGCDSSCVVSRFSTGCDLSVQGAVSSLRVRTAAPAVGNMPLVSEAYAHDGRDVGVFTTKCLDDGTTSPFMVRWGDRYDLDGVSEALSAYPPTIGVGGVSRALKRRAPSAGPFRFITGGRSVFADRCEQFEGSSVEHVTRMIRDLESRDEGFVMFVALSGVDQASHARNETRLIETLREYRDLLTSIHDELVTPDNTTTADWGLIVFGSHDTGAYAPGKGFRLDGHSPKDTGVPYMIQSYPGSPLLDVHNAMNTHGDLGRLLVPRLGCPRHVVYHTHDDDDHLHHHAHDGDWGFFLFFLLFFVTIPCLCLFASVDHYEKNSTGSAHVNRSHATRAMHNM